MLIGLQLEELYYARYDFGTDLVLVDLQLAACCQGRWVGGGGGSDGGEMDAKR